MTFPSLPSLCFGLLAIYTAGVLTSVPKYTSGKLCLTESCVTTAANLLMSMNTSVDPCTDYMEYACGSWSQNNYAPAWRSTYYGTFYWLRDDVFFKTQDLMAEPIMRNDVKAVRKMKSVYKACLDEKLINTRKGKPLMELLKSFGGWPVLEGVQTQEPLDNFDYIDMLAKLNLAGFDLLIARGVWTGYRDSTKMYLQFDQSPLMFKRRYLTEGSDFIYYYREFARKMAEALGATAIDYEKQMNDMIDFEIKLAKITDAPRDRDWDALYHRYTLDSFKSQVTDKIDMTKLINTQLRAVGKPNFDPSQEFITWAKPKFFTDFAKLIAETPKKTLKNYMLFNMVYYTVGYLDTESFGLIYNDFVDAVWGKESRHYARSSLCTVSTADSMGWALGRAFVDRYFDKGAKKIAEHLVENIRSVFIGMFGKVSWMDAKSQQTAIEKAKAIEKNVGYPLEISDDNKLNKMYEKLKVDGKKYYENVIHGWGSLYQESLMQIGETIDRKKWDVVPTVVNAFYQPSKNKISVPAAILQPPFYSKDYPEYLNYGGIGAVLGHELTHGFDSTGKDYDLHGNFRKWWPQDVLDKYKEKSNCFVHQYNSFIIPELGIHVDGRNTLDENIADNGGILESFKAYREYVKKSGKEEDSLPGLNMNNNELFFLNFAQTFCTEIFTKKAWKYFQEEVHSPDRYRVWGSVMNSKDFANTYNCRRNSKMNPRDKCEMW